MRIGVGAEWCKVNRLEFLIVLCGEPTESYQKFRRFSGRRRNHVDTLAAYHLFSMSSAST